MSQSLNNTNLTLFYESANENNYYTVQSYVKIIKPLQNTENENCLQK